MSHELLLTDLAALGYRCSGEHHHTLDGGIVNVVIAPRVDELSVIDFFAGANARPLSAHVALQEVPVRSQ